MEKECEICGKPTNYDKYRCDQCNHAWQLGYQQGYDNGQANIREQLKDAIGIKGEK